MILRQRLPNLAELRAIPWLSLLNESDRAYIEPEIRVTLADSGDYVCRFGRPVRYWFGVIDGLLKMSSDSADGRTMTFMGVPRGGWCRSSAPGSTTLRT